MNGNDNGCTKCRENSTLSNGECVADDGYYIDETDGSKIKKCDDNCLKCITTAKTCTDCKWKDFISRRYLYLSVRLIYGERRM
jgi:hypothetical protein